jgi:predicted RNA-binding Zn-ribbon protein involved in translation (DUF1610 family)
MAAEEARDDGESDEPVAVDAAELALAEDDGRQRVFPCHQCGADREWKPGSRSLACPYCGHAEELPQDERAIREFAFNDYLADSGKQRGLGDELARAVRCPGCAAEIDLAAEVAIRDCPFCGTMVEDAQAHAQRIRPEAVLPFAVERTQARIAFERWLRARWFAPSGLAKEAAVERFQGVYRSWWTFDSHTCSHWSGEAGHYYSVTRTRTVNGKTQTYQQRKVRWTRRSGVYEAFFDDVLTCGFRSGLEASGYDLSAALPYAPQALAGFVCERYSVDPQGGWSSARETIEADIRGECSRRLGGDTQRSLDVATAHQGITFKSLLLPVWHATYRHRGKTYRVAVNGQTGRVVAERPYSWLKIGLLVLALLALLFGAWVAFGR